MTVANTRWTQFINHAIQFKCDGLSKRHKNTYSSIFQTSSKQIFTSNLRYFNSFKLPYKIRLLAFRSYLKKSGTVDVAFLEQEKNKLINYALKACFSSIATKNNKIAQEIRIIIWSTHSTDRKIISASKSKHF